MNETEATKLLKWLFYSGAGEEYLGGRFPEYSLEDDEWKMVVPSSPQTWTTPTDRIRWSPVDNHLKGAFRGVVRNCGETHVPFITVDLDRHSGKVSASKHKSEVMTIGRLLARFRLRWAVETNPRNGSVKCFGFTGQPIPINNAKRIAKEIHDALISSGFGRREVFPFNSPRVFLPCRPDKITIIDSGVLRKVMRRRRYADPVECYSAVAFLRWAKSGRSYDEATLIQVLEQACRNLPDA